MAFRSSIVAVCKCLFGPTELCLCHKWRVGMVLRQLVQYRRRFSIAAVQRIGLGQLVAQLVDVYTLGGLRPARFVVDQLTVHGDRTIVEDRKSTRLNSSHVKI